jgi:hypothetical protein
MSDPINNVEPAQLVLFKKLVEQARGHSAEQVAGAAANLIVNALRQTYPTRDAAEVAFNELFGKTKQILMDHYDSTGRKKGIFPYNQVIHAALVTEKDRIN